MTFWWRKGTFMSKYVTEERFNAAMLQIEGRFDSLKNEFVTKQEFHTRMDDLLTKMDGMATILQRLDQERVFTIEWIRRIESDVDRIKHHLKLA